MFLFLEVVNLEENRLVKSVLRQITLV